MFVITTIIWQFNLFTMYNRAVACLLPSRTDLLCDSRITAGKVLSLDTHLYPAGEAKID